MNETQKSATSIATPTASKTDNKRADKALERNPNSPFKFVELGELSRGTEPRGCDPYNSTRGEPTREVWKNRKDR